MNRDAHQSAAHMLGIIRRAPSCSRAARSEIALALGEMALAWGQLGNALIEARRALHLADDHEIRSRSFTLAGDADMAHGMLGSALRNYSHALSWLHDATISSSLVRVVTLRKVLAESRAGKTAEAYEGAAKVGQQRAAEPGLDATLCLLVLETSKLTGEGRLTEAILHMRDISIR